FEFVELRLRRVVAGEPGGPLKLNNERVERTVLVVRRAEIPQAKVLFGLDRRLERGRQARLADARLACEQDYLTIAGPGTPPSPEKDFEILLAPDKQRLARAQRLEPALGGPLAAHPPSTHRLSVAFRLDSAQIGVFE